MGKQESISMNSKASSSSNTSTKEASVGQTMSMKQIADNLKIFFKEVDKSEPQKEKVVIKRIPGAAGDDSGNNWKSSGFERRRRALERLRAIRSLNSQEETAYDNRLHTATKHHDYGHFTPTGSEKVASLRS